jgi:hypothetical protein|tara:strand:- start:268 stop:540 length:273 start_codon:yes stop_codon:yes gene_type:complete
VQEVQYRKPLEKRKAEEKEKQMKFMKNIKLETVGQSAMMVNWDNVNMVKEITTSFGEVYRELYFTNGSTVVTTETMEDLEGKLNEERKKR